VRSRPMQPLSDQLAQGVGDSLCFVGFLSIRRCRPWLDLRRHGLHNVRRCEACEKFGGRARSDICESGTRPC
jgi:hypothetical protein